MDAEEQSQGKPKARTLVIGMGEVGTALAAVLDCTEPMLRHDLDRVKFRNQLERCIRAPRFNCVNSTRHHARVVPNIEQLLQFARSPMLEAILDSTVRRADEPEVRNRGL